MRLMILDLLHLYAAWLFAAVMFIWLGSVLYRTTRNTFGTDQSTEGVAAPTPSVSIPARPTRKPRVPLTHAA